MEAHVDALGLFLLDDIRGKTDGKFVVAHWWLQGNSNIGRRQTLLRIPMMRRHQLSS
jgi:hypothetical protein